MCKERENLPVPPVALGVCKEEFKYFSKVIIVLPHHKIY